MEYKVKIIDKANVAIQFGYDKNDKNAIKKVDIKFDTIDENVFSKGAGMLLKMTIEGDIKQDGTTTDKLMGLFNWAKSEESEEQYRTVGVEICNGDKRHLAYEFKNMFVVDYEEIYDASARSQENSKFILKLTQQENNFNDAKIL